MDWALTFQAVPILLSGLPLTLALVVGALVIGIPLALGTALAGGSGFWPARALARLYILVFRGTPLLVQIFLIYYGLGQFAAVRASPVWLALSEPAGCAILALALNTGAYGAEIVRAALGSVPPGQVDAAMALGMSRGLAFSRIVAPLAARQALPAYGNEVILMVKASALASTITLMEVSGLARALINETYAVAEILTAAGAIYLALNTGVVALFGGLERRFLP